MEGKRWVDGWTCALRDCGRAIGAEDAVVFATDISAKKKLTPQDMATYLMVWTDHRQAAHRWGKSVGEGVRTGGLKG